MKKLIFLLPLMFTLSAFSQNEKPITKGNIIISGGGTIQYSKVNANSNYNQSIFSVSLNPGIGYFFVNNLALGLTTNFNYYSTENNKFYSIGIGPTIKYYFGNGILIKGESTFNSLHGIGDNTANENTFSFKPGVGYAFFINSKVSLEPSLNYEFMGYKSDNDGNSFTLKTNSLQIELNIVVFF